MEQNIRIGSRESKLAVRQSEIIIEELKRHHPDIRTELVTMKTTGDKILNMTLDKIGGKGLFVKELDRAILSDEIDMAVHSLKDLPMEVPEELPVLAYTRREDERDVLILPETEEVWDLKKPVGCSSLRRKIQLEAIYPEIDVRWIRGNVLTRLAKLDAGEYGALVLAAAGMKRLHLESRIHRYFTVEEILPAAGQGILAVQGKIALAELARCLQDDNAADCAAAERAFVRRLDGGCSSPVAAHAVLNGNEIELTGLYYNEYSGTYQTGKRAGSRKMAEQIGEMLADELRETDGNKNR